MKPAKLLQKIFKLVDSFRSQQKCESCCWLVYPAGLAGIVLPGLQCRSCLGKDIGQLLLFKVSDKVGAG